MPVVVQVRVIPVRCNWKLGSGQVRMVGSLLVMAAIELLAPGTHDALADECSTGCAEYVNVGQGPTCMDGQPALRCGLRGVTCDGEGIGEPAAQTAQTICYQPRDKCPDSYNTAQCITNSCLSAPTDVTCGKTSGCGDAPGDCSDPDKGGGGGGGQGEPEVGSCFNQAGADPIHLSTKAALTEPFTDFGVEAVAKIQFTRTYSSADASIAKPFRAAGPSGVFGQGWHHNWEASVSCISASGQRFCTVARGLQSALEFQETGAVAGPGGVWEYMFRKNTYESVLVGQREVLARKPDGDIVLYMADGSELHFGRLNDTDCSCGAGAEYCQDAWGGGRAALVAVVDVRGNVTTVTRDLASGLLLSIQDEAIQPSSGAPMAVELHSNGCNDTRARYLSFDRDRSPSAGESPIVYVRYEYQGAAGAEVLTKVSDQGMNQLRAYTYKPGMPGHLQTVLGESGSKVAEFDYDPTTYRATSVTDALSSVMVSYTNATTIEVTSRRSVSASTTDSHTRSRGRSLSVFSDGAAFAHRLQWLRRKLQCFEDPRGYVTYYDRDGQNRVTRVRSFRKEVYSCSSSGAPQAADVALRDLTVEYGQTKAVVGGLVVQLNRPRSISSTSVLAGRAPASATAKKTKTFDFDTAAKTGDPAGYTCAEVGAALPSGAVPCRVSEAGYTMTAAGAVVEDARTTFFTYDAHARLTKVIGPVSTKRPWSDDTTPMERREYYADDDGVREHRGRLKRTIQYPAGTLKADGTIEGTNGFEVSFTYVANGLASVSDSANGTYSLILDSRGRITRVIGPMGSTEIAYHDLQKPALVVRPAGGAVRIKDFDNFGRPKTIEALTSDPRLEGPAPSVLWKERRSYDLSGNPTSITREDAAGVVKWSQTRVYNERHNPLEEHHPSDTAVMAQWTYDAADELDAVGDELNQWTEFPAKPGNPPVPMVDGLGRPLQVDRTRKNSLKEVVERIRLASYSWEARSDQLKSVTDGSGNTTNYENDDFDRVISVSSGSAIGISAVRLDWDARGNLKKRVHGNLTAEFAYDGRNRLTSQRVTSSGTAAPFTLTFQYDLVAGKGKVGKLLAASSGHRTTWYEWDEAGLLKSEEVKYTDRTSTVKTTYSRDADGLLTSVTLPSGFGATFSRDEAGRIETVATGGNRILATNVSYEPGGPVRSLTYGNGLGLSRTHNLRYEPDTIGDGPFSLSFTMGRSGNVDGVSGSTETRTFGHDLLGHLVTMTPGHGSGTPSYVFRYSGDRVIQALEVTAAGQVPRYAYGYDAQGSVSAVSTYSGTAIAATTCLVHDAAGRLVAVGPATVKATTPGGLGCQAESELSSVTVRFEYDALNRRAARWDAASGWTEYLHDPGGRLLAELAYPTTTAGAFSTKREYVWLEDRPLAQLQYPAPAGRTEGYTYYFHTDHLGLPRTLTNESGATVWSSVPARPYGDVVESTTTDPLSGRVVVTNLRLPGQYDERLLGALGLQGPYYNWNRWYLPTMGRYLELDPIALHGGFNGPFGPNWYGYAEGNPLRWTDFDGRDIYSLSHQNIPWIEGEGWGAGQKCMAECMDATNPLGGAGTATVLALGPLPKWPAWWQPGASHFTSIWRYMNIGSRSVCGEPVLSGPTTKLLGKGGVYVTLASGVVSYGVIAACAIHCAGGQ